MRNNGVWQDSDTEMADPNLPDSWEMKRRSTTRMLAEDEESYGHARDNVVFNFLDSKDPERARRRVGTLYWKAWKRVLMAFFLTAFGITFTVIGISCTMVCDEPERGLGFLVCGALVLMPGCYGSFTLFWYLRGLRGYHYRDLPEMD